MKKFERVAVQGVDALTAEEATFESRMGQERDQIAKTLMSIMEMFKVGGSQERLFGQSHSGIQFQKLNPTIRIDTQLNPNILPLISFDVGLTIDQDADLAPGFEFSTTLRKITQRVSGLLPITVNLQARSDEEIALLQWAIRQIFSAYIYRLYRGLIINIENSWQIGFPKKLDLASKSYELSEGGSGGDEQIKVSDITFSVLYDSVFIEENNLKQELALCLATPPTLTVLPVEVNPIIKAGGSAKYLVQNSEGKVYTYYLEDPEIGRVSANANETMLTVYGKKEGVTNLVVKTFKDTVSIEIEVVQ